MNEYDKQANDFLSKTKTTLTVMFLRHGKHFVDDAENRDIYSVTLTRRTRTYTFDFGQSFRCSGKYIMFGQSIKCQNEKPKYNLTRHKDYDVNENYREPRAYDILSCLSVFGGDFEEFCGDYGYYEDSIKAKTVFKKVQEESKQLKMLFNDTELEMLQEIN